MHERYRDVALLYWRMDVFGLPAANAVNEVCVMIARTFAGRPGFALVGNPRLIRIVSIGGQIAVRSVKNIPDGVGLRVFGSQRCDGLVIGAAGGFLVGSDIQPGSRHTTCSVSACSNLRLVIGDPMPHLQLQHLAFTIRLETER